MVKVIEDNSRWKGRCLVCGSIFSYKAKDLKFKTFKKYTLDDDGEPIVETWQYMNVLKCPCCRKWIARNPDNLDNFICANFLN